VANENVYTPVNHGCRNWLSNACVRWFWKWYAREKHEVVECSEWVV